MPMRPIQLFRRSPGALAAFPVFALARPGARYAAALDGRVPFLPAAGPQGGPAGWRPAGMTADQAAATSAPGYYVVTATESSVLRTSMPTAAQIEAALNSVAIPGGQWVGPGTSRVTRTLTNLAWNKYKTTFARVFAITDPYAPVDPGAVAATLVPAIAAALAGQSADWSTPSVTALNPALNGPVGVWDGTDATANAYATATRDDPGSSLDLATVNENPIGLGDTGQSTIQAIQANVSGLSTAAVAASQAARQVGTNLGAGAAAPVAAVTDSLQRLVLWVGGIAVVGGLVVVFGPDVAAWARARRSVQAPRPGAGARPGYPGTATEGWGPARANPSSRSRRPSAARRRATSSSSRKRAARQTVAAPGQPSYAAPLLIGGVAAAAGLGLWLYGRSASAATVTTLTTARTGLQASVGTPPVDSGTPVVTTTVTSTGQVQSTPRSDPNILDAQRVLANLPQHYYAGPLDGRAGPLTRAAVTAFQNDNGITPAVAGQIDDQTRSALAFAGQGVSTTLQATASAPGGLPCDPTVQSCPGAPAPSGAGGYTGYTVGSSPRFPGCTVQLRGPRDLTASPDLGVSYVNTFNAGENVILSGERTTTTDQTGARVTIYGVMVPRTQDVGYMILGSAETSQCPGA